MNKIININLAGRLIPIEEQAYDQLKSYIEWLRKFFGREAGGDEIVHDMEDRIGELFQDRLKKGAACITAVDVQHMIDIMGSPEQILSEAGDDIANEGQAQSGSQASNTAQQSDEPKRLTRNSSDKVWGGVCSGIANYLKLDPLIIRIAFALGTLAWGSGFLIYLLLWVIVPETNEPISSARRRLYRNPEQKVVGGVASGIAAYFNIDPIIPRIIFIAPLLGTIFFSVVDSDIFFFPGFIGGIPTLALLYIILWISMPEANTLAEKLEMRGEKVDVQSLSQAMKDIGDRMSKSIPAHTTNALTKMLSFVAKAFVFVILAFVLFVLGAVLIGLIGAVFGLASSSLFVLPLTGLVTDSETQKWLLWACALTILIIPILSIVRLLTRIISGKKGKGARWLNIATSVFFIAAIFGLFWIGGTIIRDFRARYHSHAQTIALTQPANDTMIIRQASLETEAGGITEYDWGNEEGGIRFADDSTIAISNINLHISKSPDSMFHLTVQRRSNGRNSKRAEQLASALVFAHRQEGNVLYLPQDFKIPGNQPFRGQQMLVELQVPAGKVFSTQGLSDHYYTHRTFNVGKRRFNYQVSEHYYEYENGKYYRMQDNGIAQEL
jgi:phage shock protein PspC (stress-responsive transcriptional regulator)